MLTTELTVSSAVSTISNVLSPVLPLILLLAFLLIIRIVSKKLIKRNFFDYKQASRGKQSNVETCIALIFSIFFMLCIKKFPLSPVFFAIYFANFIVALYGNFRRSIWHTRIQKALKNQLGNTLKRVLPANCRCYSVNNLRGSSMAIDFEVNDDFRTLSFESLGYKDLPVIYTDIICRWIHENIVYDKDNYDIQEIIIETESWEGGSPDYIKTTITSTGFESHRVSGDPGYQKIRKTTHGYELVHKERTTEEKTQKLNKWK